MRINCDFDYAAYSGDIADEFCENNSEYQAEVLNIIGQQFKAWSQDMAKPFTYMQILEIAEQLNDSGKWFIRTLCDYMDGGSEGSKE